MTNILITGRKDLDNMLYFFIYPSVLISLILIVIIPVWRSAGFVYLALSIVTWFVYITPNLKDYLYGISKSDFTPQNIGLGILLGVGFLTAKAIFPFLSIIVPSQMLTVSSNIKFFIGVVIAPAIEEPWRNSVVSFLMTKIKKFWKINLIQSVLFGTLHFLVLGILLGMFSSWSQVFGQILAVSGLLLGTISYALFAGWILYKRISWIPNLLGHGIINGTLMSLAIGLFSVGLPGF